MRWENLKRGEGHIGKHHRWWWCGTWWLATVMEIRPWVCQRKIKGKTVKERERERERERVCVSFWNLDRLKTKELGRETQKWIMQIAKCLIWGVKFISVRLNWWSRLIELHTKQYPRYCTGSQSTIINKPDLFGFCECSQCCCWVYWIIWRGSYYPWPLKMDTLWG